MSKRHIPAAHTAHPNVTPLIDIIMCLIIFFMLVAKIGVTTGSDKIDIPKTIIGSKIDDMSNTLTLNIPEENSKNPDSEHPIVTALITPSGGGKPAFTNLTLFDSTTHQNVLLNTLQFYKKQNEKLKVIIRASSQLDWRYIEPVLLNCQEAGVRSINFNTAMTE